jgi:hypothetical protein
MILRALMLTVVLTGSLGPGLFHASADLEVTAGVSIRTTGEFYEPLASQGAWVEVGSYGRCWHPVGVAVGWRPYCNGYWEWTDCGWYWVSDEPWAWACYHYGSWVYDSNQGWVWVPGVEWAPAWVYWRIGGDHIGWAPCGPPGFTVEPSFYVFVESRHFHDRVRPDTIIVNNAAIIQNTTEIKNVRRASRQFDGKSQTVIVNEGPSVDVVQKATGKKFTAVSVREADRHTSVSIPEQMKRRTDEPGQEQPKPIPGGNPEMPNNLPPDRTIPQTPPETIIPPANKELPMDKDQQRPNEIIPPSQPPSHPLTPVAPSGNLGPNNKAQDKDKDQDHGHDNP